MTTFRDHLTPLTALSADWQPSWFIEHIWQANALNFLYGVPRARKTTLRRYLMACSFLQRPAFGRYAPGPVPQRALILLGEEILEAEGAYLHQTFRQLGADSAAYADRIDILDAAAGVRLDTPAVEQLYAIVDEGGYDFIAIDPLINFHRQNENEAAAMANVLARTKPLWRQATVVVIHHEGKPGENTSHRTTSHRARGSSAMPGYTASNCLLTRTEGTDFHKLTVDAKYAPERVCVELEFANGLWNPRTTGTLEQAQELARQGVSATQIAKQFRRGKEWALNATRAVQNQTSGQSTT